MLGTENAWVCPSVLDRAGGQLGEAETPVRVDEQPMSGSSPEERWKMENNETSMEQPAGNPSSKPEALVSVRLWVATAFPGLVYIAGQGYVVVVTAEGETGLMSIDYGHALDGSDDWCVLDVIGADGASCTRYTAGEIAIPTSLRKHIARTSLKFVAGKVCGALADLRWDIPEFGAYVSGTCLAEGGYERGELSECFLPWLRDLDVCVGCEQIQQLEVLAGQCADLWREGRDGDPRQEWGTGD